MSSETPQKPVLYSYYRSSCSARLRIALALKQIEYETVFVNIKDGAHHNEDYIKVNPSVTVPTLQIAGTSITQSVAAMEYLEETHPHTGNLLPPVSDAKARALVRTLVAVVASDIQPVTNMKVLQHIGPLGIDSTQWIHKFAAQGFAAYEAIARSVAGKFSVGDVFTMADVCLVPAVWNAERFKIDMTPYPTVMRVYRSASELPAVQKGHWQNQPDCPEDLRK
ncbi:hypothetical protein ANO11243_080790 [Dothideomycetidae sp. 11243]|nr:hypothetical protein ANO11243_080790 [fungal sp. No.11243]